MSACSPLAVDARQALDWRQRLIEADGPEALAAAIAGIAAAVPGVARAWLAHQAPDTQGGMPPLVVPLGRR